VQSKLSGKKKRSVYLNTSKQKAIVVLMAQCAAFCEALQKGVRLWSEKQETEIPVITDIGHSIATALKKQFEKTAAYKRFNTLINQGALRSCGRPSWRF
jgi:hypothetical protein